MREFTLTAPPSANALFVAIGRRRVKSKEYVAWTRLAGGELMVQRVKPVRGPVNLCFYVAENARRDLDNYIKPMIDALVAAGIIEGDGCKIVRSIAAEWNSIVRDGVFVAITSAPVWVQRKGAAKK